VCEDDTVPEACPKRRFGRAVVLGLLSLITLMGVTRAALEAWAGYHLRAAEKLLQRQRYAEARRHLAEAVKVRPRSPVLHLLLGRVSRQAGDVRKASEHLHRCLQLQGGVSEDLQLEQLMLRAQTGEVEAVLDRLAVYVTQNRPEAPLVLEALCQGFFFEHRTAPALKCAELWLEREPDNVQALYLKGLCLGDLGIYQPAVESLQRAWDLSPERDDIREQLALALSLAQQYPAAAAHFEALRQKDPKNRQILVGLARCRFAQGEAAEAQRLLDAVLAEDAHSAAALQARGQMALELGRPEEAEPWLREALRVEPHDHLTTYQLIICLRHLGKRDEAEELAHKVHDIETDLQRLQDLLTEDSRRTAHDPATCHELGTILLRNGRVSEGLYWLYKALGLDPGYQPTHRFLAEYWEKAGNKERAAGHRAALAAGKLAP
jgi:tetratricopeptide (TPR) repeat protein